jgi:hypothetical protein
MLLKELLLAYKNCIMVHSSHKVHKISVRCRGLAYPIASHVQKLHIVCCQNLVMYAKTESCQVNLMLMVQLNCYFI